MKPWRIRDGKMIDLGEVMRLERACFPRRERFTLEDYCQELRSGAQLTVAAIDDAKYPKLVGALFTCWRGHAEGEYIVSVAVDPAWRRHGVARALLEAQIGGIFPFRVSLEVRAGNQAAIALYEQLGFRRAEKLSHYYGWMRHGWQMIREPQR